MANNNLPHGTYVGPDHPALAVNLPNGSYDGLDNQMFIDPAIPREDPSQPRLFCCLCNPPRTSSLPRRDQQQQYWLINPRNLL